MSLRYVPIAEQGDDVQRTKYLFESAFPEEERPPFSMMLSWNHDTFFGVYGEEKYIGLVDLIVHQDLVYVFFLAIEEKCRGKGLGTRILSDLKLRYPNRRLFLLAEETGEEYPDNALRERRLRFYARNGFFPTGDVVTEFGVRYFLLCAGDPVSKEEFVDVMRSLIGEENARRFYSNV